MPLPSIRNGTGRTGLPVSPNPQDGELRTRSWRRTGIRDPDGLRESCGDSSRDSPAHSCMPFEPPLQSPRPSVKGEENGPVEVLAPQKPTRCFERSSARGSHFCLSEGISRFGRGVDHLTLYLTRTSGSPLRTLTSPLKPVSPPIRTRGFPFSSVTTAVSGVSFSPLISTQSLLARTEASRASISEFF